MEMSAIEFPAFRSFTMNISSKISHTVGHRYVKRNTKTVYFPVKFIGNRKTELSILLNLLCCSIYELIDCQNTISIRCQVIWRQDLVRTRKEIDALWSSMKLCMKRHLSLSAEEMICGYVQSNSPLKTIYMIEKNVSKS